ncbi:Uncharacterised protein [Yersinia intermedia]|uniref:hypothetical protein n=1 Tax=Yersinia intermedia TaxID=631 RepID=UPI0005E8AFE3|nr:hypothetical protein [Yersinia intermedia]CND05000.1 Uncharacterised protein [Yersinia intermedia]CNH32892.1 Uncharacterised protein [Yersinia intermedia]
MWLLILPMMLLTALIPFLLLVQDMKFEQEKIKASHLTQMLQIYHEASIVKMTRNPVPGGNSWANDVKQFLPPNIKNGSFWMQSFAGGRFPIDSAYYKSGNSCEVISFIRTTEGVVSLQNASSTFVKLLTENKISRAGVYNFQRKGFIDSTGTTINLQNFQPQLPIERNGVPVMYSRGSC